MPEKPTHLFRMTGDAVTVLDRDDDAVYYEWADGIVESIRPDRFDFHFEPIPPLTG